MSNQNLDMLISGSENLDEKISVVEFIKTLKKVESADGSVNGASRSSGDTSPSSSMEKMSDTPKRSCEKKGSGTDLLRTMRSRFQHRATEPIFTQLEAKSPEVRATSSGNGKEAAPPTR